MVISEGWCTFFAKFRSMLARDLQSIVLYDQEGKFVGVRRPSSKLPIEIDGIKIVIEDAIGSSGLDLKVQNLFFFLLMVWLLSANNLVTVYDNFFLFSDQTDPGVPIVYAGFGALMLTTCISYLSHSQVKFLAYIEELLGPLWWWVYSFLSLLCIFIIVLNFVFDPVSVWLQTEIFRDFIRIGRNPKRNFWYMLFGQASGPDQNFYLFI